MRRLVRTRSRVGVHDHARLDLARARRGRACARPRPRRRRRGRRSPASACRRSRASASRCRAARQASRIVEPSVTLTAWPSIVSSTSSGAATGSWSCGEHSEVHHRGCDGVRGGLAETADRRVAHHLRQIGEHLELVAVRLPSRAGGAPPPGGRCRRGTGRTGRTTRRGRTRRCAARRRRGRRSRRRRSRRPSRAWRRRRARPRR